MSDGKSFHIHAPVTGKARRPTVESLMTGTNKLVLVVAVVEHWMRDREVAGSTPGRGAIKSPRSTQPSIPPG